MQQIIDGDTTSYLYDEANRLAQVDGQAYTFDANGNLLATGVMTNSWDAGNRLTEVSRQSSVVSVAYNGVGDRVGQTVGVTTTYFALDVVGLPEVIQTSEGNSYLHLPGVIVAESAGGEVRYLLSDGLGSVRQAVDEVGEVVASYEFDPYGNPVDNGGGEPYGFTGEWWEDEVGLLHLRARWYLPETGTFLSRDPVESEPPYLYVRGNPVNLVDPSGMVTCNSITGYCPEIDRYLCSYTWSSRGLAEGHHGAYDKWGQPCIVNPANVQTGNAPSWPKPNRPNDPVVVKPPIVKPPSPLRPPTPTEPTTSSSSTGGGWVPGWGWIPPTGNLASPQDVFKAAKFAYSKNNPYWRCYSPLTGRPYSTLPSPNDNWYDIVRDFVCEYGPNPRYFHDNDRITQSIRGSTFIRQRRREYYEAGRDFGSRSFNPFRRNDELLSGYAMAEAEKGLGFDPAGAGRILGSFDYWIYKDGPYLYWKIYNQMTRASGTRIAYNNNPSLEELLAESPQTSEMPSRSEIDSILQAKRRDQTRDPEGGGSIEMIITWKELYKPCYYDNTPVWVRYLNPKTQEAWDRIRRVVRVRLKLIK